MGSNFPILMISKFILEGTQKTIMNYLLRVWCRLPHRRGVQAPPRPGLRGADDRHGLRRRPLGRRRRWGRMRWIWCCNGLRFRFIVISPLQIVMPLKFAQVPQVLPLLLLSGQIEINFQSLAE